MKTETVVNILIDSLKENFTGNMWKYLLGGPGSLTTIGSSCKSVGEFLTIISP